MFMCLCDYACVLFQHLGKVGEVIAVATDDRLLHDLSTQWGDHQVCE